MITSSECLQNLAIFSLTGERITLIGLLLWDLCGISLQIGLRLKVVVTTLNHDFVSIYDVIMVHHISGSPNYDVVMTE